jgi:TatD DNase family protein
MGYIDVHAHYDDITLDRIRSAFQNYSFLVLNGTDTQSNENYCKIQDEINKSLSAKEKRIIKVAVGYHPTSIKSDVDVKKAIDEIKNIKSNYIKKIKTKDIVAIGEIGLDYYHEKDKAIQELQRKVFTEYLLLAEKVKLPVIIHARNAVDDVLSILSQLLSEKKFSQKIILHCYEASEKNIIKAVDLNCYFTVPPAVIRNELFQKLVHIVPAQRMLTETDAPYQGPKKGIPVQPDDMQIAIDYIAKEKKTNSYEVSNILLSNYLRIFI